MSKKIRQPDGGARNAGVSSDAYLYSDDVTAETVAEIRKARGIDVTAKRWKIIDAMGQVVSA